MWSRMCTRVICCQLKHFHRLMSYHNNTIYVGPFCKLYKKGAELGQVYVMVKFMIFLVTSNKLKVKLRTRIHS